MLERAASHVTGATAFDHAGATRPGSPLAMGRTPTGGLRAARTTRPTTTGTARAVRSCTAKASQHGQSLWQRPSSAPVPPSGRVWRLGRCAGGGPSNLPRAFKERAARSCRFHCLLLSRHRHLARARLAAWPAQCPSASHVGSCAPSRLPHGYLTARLAALVGSALP